MKIFIKAQSTGNYLVIGNSNSELNLPSHWELPTIANEYGELNAKKVISKYITEDLALSMLKLYDLDTSSGLVKIDVLNEELDKVIFDGTEDPPFAYEHRKFIDKSTLLKMVDPLR